MKTLYKTALCIIAVIISAGCSQKFQPQSSEVSLLYKDANGVIAVKSVGYGKDRLAAVTDAQINAFKVVLFRGVPGTNVGIPLVENEQEATSRNPYYVSRFFDQQIFRNFMVAYEESSSLTRAYGTNRISVDVKINFIALRRDLEQNNIIRKFGY